MGLHLRAILLVIATAYVRGVAAEEIAREREFRRWSLQFQVGGAYGAMAAFEPAMRRAGFDKNDPALFDPSTTFPESRADGISWLAGLHYQWSAHLSLGIEAFGSPLGFVMGVHSATAPAIPFDLLVEGSASGAAAVLSVQAEDPFGIVSPRLGVGPAWYSLDLKAEGHRSTADRVGLLFDAEARFPARTRFFGSALAQYRLVGPIPIGPYSNTPLSARDPQVVFPKSQGTPNHWMIAMGLGLRL